MLQVSDVRRSNKFPQFGDIPLAKHEVTQEQYQQVMGVNPSHFSSSGEGKTKVADRATNRHPAEMVSWFDAIDFCNKLSGLQERRPCYATSDRRVTLASVDGYRLPTEAEWEYACRAGTTGAYGFDDESDLGDYAWYLANSAATTHPVGEKRPNGFGLYDVHGSVWEWCWDWYDAKYYGKLSGGDVVDPLGPSSVGGVRVLRGGLFFGHAGSCRSAYRRHGSAKDRFPSLGFRPAMTIDAVKALTRTENAPPLAKAPFDPEQAKQHQQAWAKHLGVPIQKEVDLGDGEKLTMVLIPPGEFLMGSTDEERARFLKEATAAGNQSALDATNAEGPQHRVAITKPFYLSAYEVTQQQYRLIAGTNPSYFSSSGDGKETVVGQVTQRHPVENVSWFDAVSFCNKLSEQEKRRPSYAITERNVTRTDGNGYRLPSEAEWEYACRAGSTGAFHFADESELDKHAWIAGNSRETTHPVGEKQPNGFGVYDMYGNVVEWCWDWYAAEHYETRAGRGGVNDPLGPAAGMHRVLRGGYISQNADCRSASRGGQPPNTRISDAGFRLVMTIDAVKALTRTENVPPPAVAPFDAEQAKQHQTAWVEHLGVPVEKSVDIGGVGKITMVLIPPGEFLMGSTDEERARLVEEAKAADGGFSIDRIPNEGPQHRVKITQPFWLSRHEVTRGQFRAFLEQADHKTEAERNGKGGFGVLGGKWGQDPRLVWSNPGFEQTDEHPVVQVSRNDALAFCRWLSKKAGGVKYALPSEAQWEYACRAGSTTLFYFGDSEAALREQVWSKENSPRGTHSVGQLKPNAWNLFDMHGNVWEWCADGYAADYYKQSPTDDPTGPATSPSHVSRSGGWGSHAWESRSTGRSNKTPEYADHAQGFRVAAMLVAE